MTVTVYSKPACVQCNATYRYLDTHEIPYESIDVTQDNDALEFIKSLGYAQAPVVAVASGDGDFGTWSGFRPDLLAQLSA